MAKVTEKELDQIYNEYLENVNWPVSEHTISCREEHYHALDEYLAAVYEDAFKNGYKYAMLHR